MSDKRSVATDALDTLGTAPLDDTAKRDAIHLAVEPVIAGERLRPGERITVTDGVAMSADGDDVLGIVDPFLPCPVRKGQRFWFVMLPRTIKSLRHVWSHPAFADEPVASAVDGLTASEESERSAGVKAESKKWLREYCDREDVPDYSDLMDRIGDGGFLDEYGIGTGDQEYRGSLTSEFWDHVEIVLGHKVSARPTYFSCAC